MPEPRFDPLGRRWVLLAPERAARGAPPVPASAPDPAPCDFCEGREDRTPPEVAAVRGPGTVPDAPGWTVRVVPNLYPAVQVHEVVVHTPDHNAAFEELASAHRLDVMRTYRGRAASAPTPCVLVAFNRGREAGASRSHEHGQVFGLDIVPPTIERECAALDADECLVCGLRESAPAIVNHGNVVAVAHPVPLVAHEVLILPPCEPRFGSTDDETLDATGAVIAHALAAARGALGAGLSTNLVVHTAPAGTDRFHWHAHLYPRTNVWGALEIGAELPIVAADPRRTAELLRAAISAP